MKRPGYEAWQFFVWNLNADSTLDCEPPGAQDSKWLKHNIKKTTKQLPASEAWHIRVQQSCPQFLSLKDHLDDLNIRWHKIPYFNYYLNHGCSSWYNRVGEFLKYQFWTGENNVCTAMDQSIHNLTEQFHFRARGQWHRVLWQLSVSNLFTSSTICCRTAQSLSQYLNLPQTAQATPSIHTARPVQIFFAPFS